jgi:hypothetical protein
MAPDNSAAFRERGTDPLSADEGRLDTRSRQHYREFLTAHAAEYVVRSKCGGCDLAECSDHGVADRMAVCVIDGLEPIEVEHHDRNRQAIAPAALQNSLGALQEGGPIGDTRQNPCGQPSCRQPRCAP